MIRIRLRGYRARKLKADARYSRVFNVAWERAYEGAATSERGASLRERNRL